MQTEATAAATCRARTLRAVAPPLFRPQLALVGLRCTIDYRVVARIAYVRRGSTKKARATQVLATHRHSF